MNKFTSEVAAAIKRANDRVAASIKPLGPIQTFELIERIEDADGVRYKYRIGYSTASFFFMTNINKEGKISGYDLRPE